MLAVALEQARRGDLADYGLQSLRPGFVRDLSYALQQRVSFFHRQRLAEEESLRIVAIMFLKKH